MFNPYMNGKSLNAVVTDRRVARGKASWAEEAGEYGELVVVACHQ